MSRIGKATITVPAGVDVTVAAGRITVKGPKGELARVIPGNIIISQEGVVPLILSFTRPSLVMVMRSTKRG